MANIVIDIIGIILSGIYIFWSYVNVQSLDITIEAVKVAYTITYIALAILILEVFICRLIRNIRRYIDSFKASCILRMLSILIDILFALSWATMIYMPSLPYPVSLYKGFVSPVFPKLSMTIFSLVLIVDILMLINKVVSMNRLFSYYRSDATEVKYKNKNPKILELYRTLENIIVELESYYHSDFRKQHNEYLSIIESILNRKSKPDTDQTAIQLLETLIEAGRLELERHKREQANREREAENKAKYKQEEARRNTKQNNKTYQQQGQNNQNHQSSQNSQSSQDKHSNQNSQNSQSSQGKHSNQNSQNSQSSQNKHSNQNSQNSQSSQNKHSNQNNQNNQNKRSNQNRQNNQNTYKSDSSNSFLAMFNDCKTEREAKKRYHKLAKKYHSDGGNFGNDEKMKELNAAYEIIQKKFNWK